MKHTLCCLLLLINLLAFTAWGATPMRILGIGNSFTQDLMHDVPVLLEGDTALVELAFLQKSSGTIEDHLSNLQSNQREYLYYHYNNHSQNWDTLTTCINDVLRNRSWDYIILHQASFHAGVFSTVKNSLPELSDYLLEVQPHAKLVWQLTWAYAQNARFNEFSIYDYSQSQMLYQIVDVAAQILHDPLLYHINSIIPSGIVIQRLRQSRLEDANTDLCLDGRHIDQNIGRYALACTFYQMLLSEALHRSIIEVSAHKEAKDQYAESDYSMVRQLVFDICTHLDRIWEDHKVDNVYKADYYNLMGRRIYHLDRGQYLLEHDYYESGKKHGHLILLTE